MKSKAQSIGEYALFLSVIISAIVAMQIYVKRAFQARLKMATDYSIAQINEKADARYKGQYEPYYTDDYVTQKENRLETAIARQDGSRRIEYKQDGNKPTVERGGYQATRVGE